MRWLMAGALGALGGVVYLIFFLSRAKPDPLTVFAVVGILATVLDALGSKYLARRSDDHAATPPRSPTRVVLRFAGVFMAAFLSGLAVSVLFVLQMAP